MWFADAFWTVLCWTLALVTGGFMVWYIGCIVLLYAGAICSTFFTSDRGRNV